MESEVVKEFVESVEEFLKGGPGSGVKGHITHHPNYSKADYDELKRKGYTDDEIKAIWDRDRKNGHTEPNPRKDLKLPKNPYSNGGFGPRKK